MIQRYLIVMFPYIHIMFNINPKSDTFPGLSQALALTQTPPVAQN